MVCTAPSTYFWNLVFYLFPAIPKHVIWFHAQSTISANGLGCLLQVRGAQCVFPICFCVNVACIHPLGFRSNGNLFPTLAQPCVSGFMPRPDSRIPMLKPCALKKLVSYIRAFPVHCSELTFQEQGGETDGMRVCILELSCHYNHFANLRQPGLLKSS